MYMGGLPLFLMFTLFFLLITSGEGPTCLKEIGTCQTMAYRKMHIKNTTYLNNLGT